MSKIISLMMMLRRFFKISKIKLKTLRIRGTSGRIRNMPRYSRKGKILENRLEIQTIKTTF
jgi:hypothetical protein